MTLSDQVLDCDEVIVVGDGEQPMAQALFESSGLPGFYCHTKHRYQEYGDFARNYGMSRATKKWLMFIDDDDGMMPGAIKMVRQHMVTTPVPSITLYRMAYCDYWRYVWKIPKKVIWGNVSTQNVVVTNDQAYLGRWGNAGRGGGDLKFIESTVAKIPHAFMRPEFTVNYNQFENLNLSANM